MAQARTTALRIGGCDGFVLAHQSDKSDTSDASDKADTSDTSDTSDSAAALILLVWQNV